MITLAATLLAFYFAYRYSQIEIDPDWSYFNLYTFTGARYGRDYADCKMPTIHIYYAILGRIVGHSIPRIRFLHHVLISLPGILVGEWVGLAYVVLVNSGWLLAFHGNVGQQAAGLILLAMWLDAPWISAVLVVFAILFEPKLAFSGLLLSLYAGFFLPFVALCAVGGLAAMSVWKLWPQMWSWLWEANIEIPRRMVANRRAYLKTNPFMNLYVAMGYLYVLPWIIGGIALKPDLLYWAPMVIYVMVIHAGLAVRQNHYLPIVPWLAFALSPQLVAALLLVDLLSAGLYRGDIWHRFYPGLRSTNLDARKVGEWLRDKPGELWVNAYHSAIYIYSGKPPVYGMTEQLEIRENVPERRETWRKQFKYLPPRFVVTGPGEGWVFNGTGYNKVAESREYKVYERS